MFALPKKSWLIFSLTLALPASRLRAETCYADEDVSKIAGAIRALDVCEETLRLREQFIETQKLEALPAALWWQEPTVIVGGLAVSFTVGSLVTLYLVKDRL